MMSNISSMTFATSDKMSQQEYLKAENLLKKHAGENGTIDYTNKSQDEIDKINDAAIVVLSSKASEEEGSSSFSMNIDASNQLYNEKGLSSVTDSALFRSAETKYASSLNAGIATDTLNANEDVLNNLEQSIEEQALKAQEEAAAKLKEEKAQIEAERVESNTNKTEQSNNVQHQDTASGTKSTQAASSDVKVKDDTTSSSPEQKASTTPDSVDTYV